MRIRLSCLSLLLVAVACRTESSPALAASARDTIRTTVDSIFPVEEEIRRFKAAHGGTSATDLTGGSDSRAELVGRFMTAIEKRDTADFRAMTLTSAEFIDLYYPTSMYSHPPYKQSPEIAWLFTQQNSDLGLRRVLDRFGGQPQHFESYTCKAEPRVEGANRFWDDCMVKFAPGSSARRSAKLFAAIIERGGKFKVLSYSNPL